MEAMDTGFSAFLSTVIFHHKYRNPFLSTFSYLYGKQKPDEVPPPEVPGKIKPEEQDGENPDVKPVQVRPKKSWRTRCVCVFLCM
jgi:hypothetical protein